MAKRADQNRAVGFQRSERGLSNLNEANQATLAGEESKATEIIEVAIDDLRLIASAFEMIDLSFRQFPDKFSSGSSRMLDPLNIAMSEADDLEEKIILH